MPEFIKSFLNKKAVAVSNSNNAIAGESVTSINTLLSTNVNGLNYYKNWVYIAVSARARRVAEIKFEVYLKGERKYNHEIIKLLNDVDYEAVSSFLDLTGNAFLYIERFVKTNRPSKLYVLHPSLVRPVLDQNNMLNVAYYEIGTKTQLKLPSQDVIHIKNFNPRQMLPYEGLGSSIVESIASSILTDESARQWNYNFFQNSARPDGFLTTDKKLSKEEIDQIREKFISKYAGTDNAHKIGLLSGGMDFKQVSLSQKDIDFIEQSRMSKDEILSAFGVPRSEVGLTDGLPRANLDGSSYVFSKNTIEPIMRKITNAFIKKLLLSYEDGLELCHVSIVPEDRVQLLAERIAGYDKWLSRNEIRKEDGLPEVEGGDNLYQQFSMTPVATVPRKALSIEIKPDYKGAFALLKQIKKKQMTDAHIKSWLNIFKSLEPGFEKDIKDYFNEQEKVLLAELKKIDKSFTINQTRDIFKGNAWDSQISLGVSFMTPRIRQYLKEGANNASELTGYNDFQDNTRDIETFIKTRAEYFSKKVNETTRDTLLTKIQDGLDNSESMDQIISRVKEVYTFANDVRAKTIARTEISASANAGKIELYKQAGIEKIEWYNLDPESEECQMNAGEIRDIGDQFPSGDTEPPAHPNCKSTTIAILD